MRLPQRLHVGNPEKAQSRVYKRIFKRDRNWGRRKMELDRQQGYGKELGQERSFQGSPQCHYCNHFNNHACASCFKNSKSPQYKGQMSMLHYGRTQGQEVNWPSNTTSAIASDPEPQRVVTYYSNQDDMPRRHMQKTRSQQAASLPQSTKTTLQVLLAMDSQYYNRQAEQPSNQENDPARAASEASNCASIACD
uniref:Uncharacterized protein n=1 Tax=Plectus sambesii TaxID=2011161 RepID=A0A914VUH4_9BILA